MRLEEAFLVEIAEHPDDPAARLIYADWLDEHGDPRGEFIRIEQELSSLPVQSERYWGLKARRDELRAQIDADWLACLNYAPGCRPLFTTIPEHRSDRWKLLDEFIEYWYGPSRPGAGAYEHELLQYDQQGSFPAALREWYALMARRMDVWSYQNELVRPAMIPVDGSDEALIFRRERWGTVLWGIRQDDLQQEDPPIYCFGVPYAYRATLASSSVSKFAIAVAVQDAMRARLVCASGHLGRDRAAVEELRHKLQRTALSFRCESGTSIECREGPHLLAIDSRAGGWFYLVVRTEEAFEQLSPRVHDRLRRR